MTVRADGRGTCRRQRRRHHHRHGGGPERLAGRVACRVRGSGAVATFAARAVIRPSGVVAAERRVIALRLSRGMTAETIAVPDLDRIRRPLVRVDDVEVVDPLAPFDIPRRRQDDDASVGQRRQVVLNAPAARACSPRDGPRPGSSERAPATVNRPLDASERVARAPQRDGRPRKVADDTRRAGRLQHLAVPRRGPGLVLAVVALRALWTRR